MFVRGEDPIGESTQITADRSGNCSGDLGGEDRRVGQGDDVDDFHCWDPTDETRCPVGSTRLVFNSTVLSSGLSFDSCGRRIRSRARILKTSRWEGLMPMAGGDGDDGLTC